MCIRDSIYDIWDIKASDTINIDGTIYEVIHLMAILDPRISFTKKEGAR